MWVSSSASVSELSTEVSTTCLMSTTRSVERSTSNVAGRGVDGDLPQQRPPQQRTDRHRKCQRAKPTLAQNDEQAPPIDQIRFAVSRWITSQSDGRLLNFNHDILQHAFPERKTTSPGTTMNGLSRHRAR